MDRRRFLLTSLAGALAAPLAAKAQAGKVWRIGILGNRPSPHLDMAFRHGLRDLGWIEDQNIVLIYRYTNGQIERAPVLAAELILLNVDLIVAWAGQETAAARRATPTIPIVFLTHGDPVGTGDVMSLRRPGGNVTGMTAPQTEIAGKRLELLMQTIPGLARVGVLWNAGDPLRILEWQETQSVARALSLKVQSFEVRTPPDFDGAFTAIKRERPDGLLTLPDPLTYSYRALILDFAAKTRLAGMYGSREFVDDGGLIAYGVDFRDLFRQGATYVDKILRGARPADLPVERARKFELVINLKTAKALGLTIPPSLLARADQVIE